MGEASTSFQGYEGEGESNIVRKTTSKWLKHHFTTEERSDLVETMSEGVIELNSLQEEKKTVVSQYQSKINEVQAKVHTAAQRLSSGFEMRMQDCEIVYDYDHKTVEVFQLDPLDLIEERTMTAQELQMAMDFDREQKPEETSEDQEEGQREGEGQGEITFDTGGTTAVQDEEPTDG